MRKQKLVYDGDEDEDVECERYDVSSRKKNDSNTTSTLASGQFPLLLVGLPLELQLHLLSFLTYIDLGRFARVSRLCYQVFCTPDLWSRELVPRYLTHQTERALELYVASWPLPEFLDSDNRQVWAALITDEVIANRQIDLTKFGTMYMPRKKCATLKDYFCACAGMLRHTFRFLRKIREIGHPHLLIQLAIVNGAEILLRKLLASQEFDLDLLDLTPVGYAAGFVPVDDLLSAVTRHKALPFHHCTPLTTALMVGYGPLLENFVRHCVGPMGLGKYAMSEVQKHPDERYARKVRRVPLEFVLWAALKHPQWHDLHMRLFEMIVEAEPKQSNRVWSLAASKPALLPFLSYLLNSPARQHFPLHHYHIRQLEAREVNDEDEGDDPDCRNARARAVSGEEKFLDKEAPLSAAAFEGNLEAVQAILNVVLNSQDMWPEPENPRARQMRRRPRPPKVPALPVCIRISFRFAVRRGHVHCFPPFFAYPDLFAPDHKADQCAGILRDAVESRQPHVVHTVLEELRKRDCLDQLEVNRAFASAALLGQLDMVKVFSSARAKIPSNTFLHMLVKQAIAWKMEQENKDQEEKEVKSDTPTKTLDPHSYRDQLDPAWQQANSHRDYAGIIEHLIQRGADFLARDNRQNIPLDYATDTGVPEIVAVLTKPWPRKVTTNKFGGRVEVAAVKR